MANNPLVPLGLLNRFEGPGREGRGEEGETQGERQRELEKEGREGRGGKGDEKAEKGRGREEKGDGDSGKKGQEEGRKAEEKEEKKVLIRENAHRFNTF